MVRQKLALPSLAAVIVQNGKILESTAVGERAIGSGVRVQLEDTFQLGSLSKSFTATMIAKLVEQKILRWDTTLEQVFTGQKMLAIFRNVTLEQLLFHVAGFYANLPDEAVYDWNLEPKIARAMYLEQALNTAPEYAPSRGVAYSNVGFVVAALAAEKATGKTWEALIQELILIPLEMKNCAFGTQFKALSQPHGHEQIGTRLQPVSPEEPNGNSPVLYGADGIRCSMPDYGKYILAHLNGERGINSILSSESFIYLHKARANAGQDIRAALGWFVFPNGALWHNGSNTINYAEVIINTKNNFAIAVATNAPIELGAEVSEAAFTAIINYIQR